MSLRSRLTIWVIALFVVLQLATTIVILLYQRSSLEQLFDEQLGTRAGAMAEHVSTALPELTNDDLQRIAREASARISFTPFRVMVVGRDGSDWTRSSHAWPSAVFAAAAQAITSNRAVYETVEVDWFSGDGKRNRSARVVARPIRGSQGNPYALVMATSDEPVRAQQALITRAFVIAGLIGLAASAISGWHIAGLATKPLHEFKRVAAELGPTSISKEIKAASTVAEVQELSMALNEARMRIRDAFAAQDRFLSTVSHELKTPIATLLVEAQTIDPAGLNASAAAFVRNTEEEMRRLGRLIESFLTLTRIRDGKGLARMANVPANDLIIESVSHCSAMARQRNVLLAPELLEDDSQIDAAIPGDPELLRTMMDNLVRNAIRFSPTGAAVRVAASIDSEGLFISVLDKGPSMPLSTIDRVFDAYGQKPGEPRTERGHGLGLTIAQAVAELHGGHITALNRDDGGAEFRARMPWATPRSTAAAGLAAWHFDGSDAAGQASAADRSQ